jgi:hypothetical protein
VRRLAFVSRSGALEIVLKRVRRRLLLFAVRRILRQIERVDETGVGFFSYHDVVAFFDAEDRGRQKDVFNDLLPHLEAATASDITVQQLADKILELARSGYNDLVTAYLALLGMIGHVLANPPASIPVLDELLTHLGELYPPTTDPEHPTAAIWYQMMLHPFIHIPYKPREAYTDAELEQVTDILRAFLKHAERFDREYMGICRFEHRKPLRIVAGQEFLFGYALQISELGPDKLSAYLDRVLVDDTQIDEQRLLDLPFVLNDAMVYHDLPKAGTAAIRDVLVGLRPYLAEHPEFAHRFWDRFREKVLPWVGAYKGEWVDLVENLRDDDVLPEDVQSRILAASPAANFDYYFMLSTNMFVVASLKGKDSFVRNVLRWGFRVGLEVNDIEKLGIEVVVQVGNLVYGDELFHDKKLVSLDLRSVNP